MTTFAEGVTLAEDAPANAITKGSGGARVSLQQDAPKPVRLGGSTGEEADAGDGKAAPPEGMAKSLSSRSWCCRWMSRRSKQLQDLLEIVGELEDKINSGEDPDDDPETDFALA